MEEEEEEGPIKKFVRAALIFYLRLHAAKVDPRLTVPFFFYYYF